MRKSHVYVNSHIHAYVYMRIYIYVYIYVCLSLTHRFKWASWVLKIIFLSNEPWMCTHLHLYVHVYMTYIHIYIHIHTYKLVYIDQCIFVWACVQKNTLILGGRLRPKSPYIESWRALHILKRVLNMYIYTCVCVCVCSCMRRQQTDRSRGASWVLVRLGVHHDLHLEDQHFLQVYGYMGVFTYIYIYIHKTNIYTRSVYKYICIYNCVHDVHMHLAVHHAFHALRNTAGVQI